MFDEYHWRERGFIGATRNDELGEIVQHTLLIKVMQHTLLIKVMLDMH